MKKATRKKSGTFDREGRELDMLKVHQMAYDCAKDAHENHFQSRRGIYGIKMGDGMTILCIYDNNPYANFPARRDEETALYRDWLAQHKIGELAYATYPPGGDEGAGYTYAMLIDAGEERIAEVTSEFRRILLKSYERMNSDSPISTVAP